MMTADDVAAISVPVLGLSQLTKWMIQRGEGTVCWLGPISIFFYAAIAVFLWVWSNAWPPEQTMAFEAFANWVVVTLTAAGIYGFTRNMDRRPDETHDPESPPGPLSITRLADPPPRMTIDDPTKGT